MTLSGKTAYGGCHFPVPGRPPVPCMEYFYVDATITDQGGAGVSIEDAALEMCRTDGCTGWGKPNSPISPQNRYSVAAGGTVVLSFWPLYAVNARPDTVRVTATAVAGEKRTRLQAELAVPQSQPQ